MALDVDVITDPNVMERDLPSYTRLLESCSDGSVFMRMEWQSAWWRHYGRMRQLQAIRVMENGRLVGYGPFMTTELGKVVKASKLEFVGAGHSDRLGILAENDRKDVIESVLDGMMSQPRWDVGELRDVRQDGPTARGFLERFPQAEVDKADSPCITVRPTFKEYLAGLSQNARHNMVRTCAKNMIELDAKFVRISDQEALPGALEEFLRLNRMRWSDKGEDSVLTPQMMDFLREAIGKLSTEHIPVIHALQIREKNISMCLGFEYQNRYLYYLSGFDPAYSRHGPGRCLLSKIIEEAHERKLKEVDLLRGDEEYKYHLGGENRVNLTVRIRKPSLRARILDRTT